MPRGNTEFDILNNMVEYSSYYVVHVIWVSATRSHHVKGMGTDIYKNLSE